MLLSTEASALMLRAYKRENPTGAMIGIQTVTIAVAGRHIQVGCNRRAEVDWGHS